jgi:uncharacterized damage-inducible protein DinB
MHEADRQIIDVFNATRLGTIDLAGRLPGELLALRYEGDFTPQVAATLLHIADGPHWWLTHCMQDGGRWSPPPATGDRSTVLEWLSASGDRLLRFFEADDGANMGRSFRLIEEKGGDGPWTGRDRLMYLAAHETHHRAKLVLVLRQAGFADFPFFPF